MSRTRVLVVWLATLCQGLCATLALGASTSVGVPGIADIWLAGQPNGTTLNGGFPGSDVAPTNSPRLGSAGLDLTPGSYLTFTAAGSTDYNGCAGPSPDGGLPCGAGPIPGAFGISGYNGPVNALIGVFVDASVPGGTAPAPMDFTTPGSLAQATISPQLRQVFFIGDGLTGTGTGAVQRFVIPPGATRLFLASSDGLGANYNNFGAFSVLVADAAGPTAVGANEAIPTVSQMTLALIALALAMAGAHHLRRRAGAMPARRRN